MNDEIKEKKSFGQVISDAFKELRVTLGAFVKAPRALWGINIPYLVEGLCYFGILTILGKYASENIMLTDEQAGWLYGAVTGGITLAMLFFGGIVDKIGVRVSMGLALGMMAIGRGIIAFGGSVSMGHGITSPYFFITAGGLLIMVLAWGLYQPAVYAGIKRYTNPKTAAVAFAVIYAVSNLGAFVFGPISSFSRKYFSDVFPPNGLTAVFWILTMFTIASSVLVFTIIRKRVDQAAVERVKRETEEMEKDEGKEPDKKEERTGDVETAAPAEKEKSNNVPLYCLLALTIGFLALAIAVWLKKVDLSASISTTLLIIGIMVTGFEFLRHRPDHPFRNSKFMVFIFVLIPVQTLFAHNWLTIPYYLDRAFRGTTVGEHFEIFANLNPLLIFIFAPIIAGLTARVSIYKMMVAGTFVMAAPAFLPALGTSAFLIVAYIVIMTIGEAMWQPRFLQWIAEIAPEGKTGAYMGIGQFPWFLTKVLTSLYSGYFIARYVPKPETGLAVNPEPMWFYYALIAMVTPLVLLLLSKWLGKGMEKKH
jgi:MFS family permease